MSKFMKSLYKIAIPVTLQSMLQASFSIVDQIMIGQLGEANISALFLLAAGVFPSQILGLYTKDMDIINTGLNYLLIFGKLGFSCMGIKGAAIATLISQLFNLVFIVIGFILCIRKDGDRPVLSLHFKKITIKDCLCLLAAYVFSLVCADLLLAVQTVGYLAAWIQLHVRRTKKPGTAYNAVPGFYETRDEIIALLLSTMIPDYLLSGVCHCQSRISSRS